MAQPFLSIATRRRGTAEVQTNKGAANGYASLNASQKVVQDPANAQTSAAASKIPIAGGGGTIDDAWLSSSVTKLGATIELDSGEVTNTLPASKGGTGANNAATSGRYLRADGTNFVTSSVAAAGAGSCTNQFVRAANDNAAPTCATVQKTDAAPTFVHTDQANTYSAGAQDFGSAASLKLPTASSSALGQVNFDTSQKNFGGYSDSSGGRAPFPRVLFVGNCTTDGNCSTEAPTGNQQTDDTNGTSEIAFAMSYTIPANLLTTRKVLRVIAGMECDAAASPPSGKLRLRLGGASGAIVFEQPFAASGCNTSDTTGYGYTWLIQGTAAPGASVSVEVNLIGSFQGGNYPNTIAQPVGGINTTASQAITVTFAWSSNAANTHRMRLRQLIVEELN